MKLVLLIPLMLMSCASARTERMALTLTMANGTCSGTAVGRNLILTAAHCFKGGELVQIDGKPAKVLEKVEDGQDHAIIRVDRRFRVWTGYIAKAYRGDSVTWTGNPQHIVGVVRRGYVAKVYGDGELLLDAAATGGDSGSGIFNSEGRLIGVLSGAYTWTHGSAVFSLIFCKPIKFTRKQWAEIRE